MPKPLNERINIAIMENQKTAHDWDLCELACELYWWVDCFNTCFFKDQPVPVPVISFAKAKVNNPSHYVEEKNAFGISENININPCHLDRPLWKILATLLHEMCHSWQHSYGTPSKSWFHNKEFRLKMLSFGMVTDSKGAHAAVRDPFAFLLKKHAVRFNTNIEAGGTITVPANQKQKGHSKLKKWACGCTNIRVAVKNLEAKCLKCGNRFELIE